MTVHRDFQRVATIPETVETAVGAKKITVFSVHVPESIFKSSYFKKDFGSNPTNSESKSATKDRIKIMDFG